MAVTPTDFWSTGDVTKLYELEKDTWVLARRLQNLPKVDIHRYAFGSENRALMTRGSTTDSGYLNYDATVENFTLEEQQAAGGRVLGTDKRFVIYDFQVKHVDVLEYPNSSGSMWNVISVTFNATSGRCEVTARPKHITGGISG